MYVPQLWVAGEFSAAELIDIYLHEKYISHDIPRSGIELVDHMYTLHKSKRWSIAKIQQHKYLTEPVR